jgi:hypothetical protein
MSSPTSLITDEIWAHLWVLVHAIKWRWRKGKTEEKKGGKPGKENHI